MYCTFSLSVHAQAAAKEQVKDVHRWGKAPTAAVAGPSFLYPLLSTAIVYIPLLGVWQHLVRLWDLRKLQKEKNSTHSYF